MQLALPVLERVAVSHEQAISFVRECDGLRKKGQIIADIHRNQEYQREFFPEYLNNLCVNHEALTARSAPMLATWLSDHGFPYSISHIAQKSGQREEWIVIFDPKLIKNAEMVRSKALDALTQYDDRNLAPFSEQISQKRNAYLDVPVETKISPNPY